MTFFFFHPKFFYYTYSYWKKNSPTFIKGLAFKGNLLCHQSGIIIIIIFWKERKLCPLKETKKERKLFEILKCVCNEPFERQQQERPLLKG